MAHALFIFPVTNFQHIVVAAAISQVLREILVGFDSGSDWGLKKCMEQSAEKNLSSIGDEFPNVFRWVRFVPTQRHRLHKNHRPSINSVQLFFDSVKI